MLLKRFLISVICVAVIGTSSAKAWSQSTAPKAPTPAIDQRALDILKKMSDTLSQAKTVSFQARSMIPFRTPDGTWINLYGTSRVVMQRPDKLFDSTAGEHAAHDFYFDGKTITSYSPAKNLYAVKSAPPDIDAMIEEAYESDGKSFPYADILVSDPYATLTEDLVKAFYVGQATILPLSGGGSAEADHLVFSNEEVEWQIWIGTADHMPRMVSATYLDDVREPSYTVEFGGWKLNEQVVPETFIYKNTSKAAKVEFRNPKSDSDDDEAEDEVE